MEKILSDQLRTSEFSGLKSGLNIIALDHTTRWCQMEQLVSSGLESTAKDVERKEKVNQWLEMSKPVRKALGTGLKAARHPQEPCIILTRRIIACFHTVQHNRIWSGQHPYLEYVEQERAPYNSYRG
ncbi:hypothetical protein EDB82DRAFT_517837 [Fusarium venenatum]|uniref:uncharacterized protein n=1 Tax=Fusarium venenatum TaxID=56646 RepID=UPI001D8233BD|nr:hypothetical protein EDB82DRAFT_517837 [Fusarium venenatum]